MIYIVTRRVDKFWSKLKRHIEKGESVSAETMQLLEGLGVGGFQNQSSPNLTGKSSNVGLVTSVQLAL